MRSGRGGVLNGSRAASTAGSGGGGGMKLIIAAGVGIAGVTTFAVSYSVLKMCAFIVVLLSMLPLYLSHVKSDMSNL